MKKLLVSALMVAFAAGTALAQAPEKPATLEAKNGNVTFNHKSHAAVECKTCHTSGTPGKMDLDKDSAHKLCKGCHESKGAGPTKCGDCHKK
jgi:hypothetical protein